MADAAEVDDLPESLLALRVRGESCASCALRVPATVFFLLVAAFLRSFLDVLGCSLHASRCVSANGVSFEPLSPSLGGVEGLLRTVGSGNASQVRLSLKGASQSRWSTSQPGVVGEDSASGEGCQPTLRNDYTYKACGEWCKESRARNHCRYCKCQDCRFCLGLEVVTAGGAGGGGGAPAFAPVASSTSKILVVGLQRGAEMQHSRALGHKLADLGHEVEFLSRAAVANDEPAADGRRARGRRRGGALHHTSIEAASASSSAGAYATVIVHLHDRVETSGATATLAEIVRQAGESGSQVRAHSRPSFHAIRCIVHGSPTYSPQPHFGFAQVICVCDQAQPSNLLHALWRRLWVPAYCTRAVVLPSP